MEAFTIVPRDCSGTPTTYEAFDVSSAMVQMERIGCECADVFQAELYCFSLEQTAKGAWTVFTRPALD